ncbi:MAG: hypothetical protein K6G45_02855 [Lachnospiraceae bacterium]|nr:hypothetical protein [Lachnospiraceae bacterium]
MDEQINTKENKKFDMVLEQNKKIESIADAIISKINELIVRENRTGEKTGKMSSSVTTLGFRIDSFERRMVKLEAKIDNMDSRIARLEEKIMRVENLIEEDVVNSIQDMSEELDDLFQNDIFTKQT